MHFRLFCGRYAARSCYIEAIQEAKRGDCAAAEKLIGEGDAAFVEGHDAHAGLLQQEAEKGGSIVNLLLLHAEDQLDECGRVQDNRPGIHRSLSTL